MPYAIKIIVSVALTLAAGLVATSARAEMPGGCTGADVVEADLKNGQSSGYFIPGLKLIVINRTVLSGFSEPVRKFILAHECAHADPAVAEDEMAADCRAVQQGAGEGWIGRPEVIQICAHLARFPPDATHPPIQVRCANIRKCSGLYERPAPPDQYATTVDPPTPLSPKTPLTRLARTAD